MLPFLVHHLSMGFNKIRVYNNDETGLRWYRHPTMTCLIRHELVSLQPWPGESVMHPAWAHWIAKAKDMYSSTANYNDVWMSFLDIDEYLLIHHNRDESATAAANNQSDFNDCIGEFLDKYPQAPEISFNWAFFIQPLPLTDFGTTGYIADLPESHVQQLHTFHHRPFPPHSSVESSSSTSNVENRINANSEQMAAAQYHHFLQNRFHALLPFETNFHRWEVSTHVKSMTRLVCLEKIYNQHFGALTNKCPFGQQAVNPQGQRFTTTYAVDLGAQDKDPSYIYSLAQLNHYWALSLQDFVRKSHRGHRGVFHGGPDQYRGIDEYFLHAKQLVGNGAKKDHFVNDTAFMDKYGYWFHQLRLKCRSCLDTKWFDDRMGD